MVSISSSHVLSSTSHLLRWMKTEKQRERIKSHSCSTFVATSASVSGEQAGRWAMRRNRVSTSCPAGLENSHLVCVCPVCINGCAVQRVHAGFTRKKSEGTWGHMDGAMKANMRNTGKHLNMDDCA